MQRVALINWKNKNQDYDLSKIFSSIVTSWIVEWLEVQSWKITPGYAFIEVERDGVIFNVLFENTEDFIIDTTWTKKVFIEINQNNIDDWTINSSDWTWIWEIKIASDYPLKNFITLASISSWTINDSRVFIDIKENFNLTQMWNTFNWPDLLLKLDEEWLIPQENIPPQPAPVVWSFVKNYLALEEIPANKIFHINTLWQTTTSTAKAIWTTINQKVAFKNFSWSWIIWNLIKVFLSKNWTPVWDLKFRLESDNAGKPSWTLIDVNAYWSISQSSLTTSLTQINCLLNDNITTSVNNIWLVLYTDTQDNTNYYNIWVWTWDEFSSYIYNWNDWVNESWTPLNELIQSWVTSYYSSNAELVEYKFTPNKKCILRSITVMQQSYWWSNYNIKRVSDNVIIWTWVLSAWVVTFNVILESWVEYNLNHTTTTRAYYISSTTITYPLNKTHYTLNSITFAGVARNRCENVHYISIEEFSTSIKNENINISTNIFNLTWAKVSKANDPTRLKIEWYSQTGALSAWDLFEWIYEWVIDWLSLSWKITYLWNDWSISSTAWTTPIWVWENISSSELRLFPKQYKYWYTNIYYSSIVGNTTSWEFSFKNPTPALVKAWNSHNISWGDTRSNSLQYNLNGTWTDVKNVASSWAWSNYVEYLYIFQPWMTYRIRTNNTTSVSNFIDIDFQDIL